MRTRRIAARLSASALGLSLVLLLAACGGAAGAAQDDRAVESEREDPAQLAQEAREREQTLSQVLSRPSPDCERACELRAMICDLQERICGIAERHPSDEATQSHCEEATATCERSQGRVEAQCECS